MSGPGAVGGSKPKPKLNVTTTKPAEVAKPAAPLTSKPAAPPAFEQKKTGGLSITGRFKGVAPAAYKTDPALQSSVSSLRLAGTKSADTGTKAKPVGGMNVGALGDKDPVVPAARKQAKSVSKEKVDWKNPEKTLEHLTQFDPKAGGNDAVRCGAAVLVAGAIATGPDQFKKGLENVSTRGGAVAGKYFEMAEKARDQADITPEPGKSQLNAFADQAEKFGDQADAAAATLGKFAEKDPKSLTQADLQSIQEAVYVTANLDQRIISDKKFDPSNDQRNSYLSVDALQTYSSLMWGSKTPTIGGEALTPNLVDNGKGGAHFVLAQKDGKVAYNPWPQKDGTAFVRAKDGDGAKIGTTAGPDTLVGKSVASYGRSLPLRD